VKYKWSVTLTMGTALVLVLLASRPSVSNASIHQAATQGATSPTNQCTLIDALVPDSQATPGATQATTQSAPKSVATQTALTATTVVATPTAKAPSDAGPAEVGGGDEALTTYRDATHNFAIDYPHSWSQEQAFKTGACFTGRDASIAVQFVKGVAPIDLMAYVIADEANVQVAASGYKEVYLKASTEVRGAIILGYEWDAGKSSVTEKLVHARTDRYYLVDSLGRLVIVTETEPINQFDPDGVRDTALTYQVTK